MSICQTCGTQWNPDCQNHTGSDCAAALHLKVTALERQVEEARKVIRDAHFSGYSRGLGPCVCKWCTEKPKGKTAEEDGFEVLTTYKSSTAKCPCGAQFTWEGLDDRLAVWRDEHRPHL